MLFALTGFFRSGVDTSPAALQPDFNEHLGQPYQHIRLAGAIRGRDGKRIGWLTLLEADSFDRAEAYLHESPYFAAHLYERIEVGQYEPEVGSI